MMERPTIDSATIALQFLEGIRASKFAGVLAFSDVTVDPSNFGRFSLSLYNSECFLRMDSAALQALNVMPQRVDVNDNFSLYGLMNRGKTAMSRRLLKVCRLGALVNTIISSPRHWLRHSTQLHTQDSKNGGLQSSGAPFHCTVLRQ